jgi:hypothetical protein
LRSLLRRESGLGEQARDVPVVERLEAVVRLSDDRELVQAMRTDDGVGLAAKTL